MLRGLGAVAALFVTLHCGVAAAETRQKLYSSGSWTLFRTDTFVFIEGDSFMRAERDGVCLAETGNATSGMSFTVPLKGRVFTKVWSSSWNFRQDEGVLVFDAEEGNNLIMSGALYKGDLVMFDAGNSPDGNRLFTETAVGTISVVDRKGRTIARFPSAGLKAVYRKMLQCGGM